MKFLCVVCALCGLASSSLGLDRGAFTFTRYDLNVRVEPEQQRLAVRGKIILRNDSNSPQKNFVLQISSTLNWQSIQADGKPVQFETHQYISDIDHTGALTEAVVSLPQAVMPQATIELQVGYEGVIPFDTTRLTRIGVPNDKARHLDWDQISRSFTAVRGIGYVVWYPIATEAANLSEDNTVEEVTARWKSRESDAQMSVVFESTSDKPVFFSGSASAAPSRKSLSIGRIDAFSLTRPGIDVPTLVIADYSQVTAPNQITIQYLSNQNEAAKDYAEIAGQIETVIPKEGALQVLSLPDPEASSFVSRGMLLMPLKSEMTNEAELAMVYAKARQSLLSSRPWIEDGFAHYAQAAFVEKVKGRQAAVSYLSAHASALIEAEKAKSADSRALIDGSDDVVLQTKSMYVWWMLKDMIGTLFSDALAQYDTSKDGDPKYMQALIDKATGKNLQWFFDDWVYHDHGLPDFRVDQVFSSALDRGGFLVTVTIENLGNAGAEVPVILKAGDDEIRQRLEVRARAKASVRIEAPSAPTEVTVNDGSVPESDISNNQFKIPSPSPSPAVR